VYFQVGDKGGPGEQSKKNATYKAEKKKGKNTGSWRKFKMEGK